MVVVLTAEQINGMTRGALIKRLCDSHGRMQGQMIKFSDDQLKEMLIDLEDVETVSVEDIDLTPIVDEPEERRVGRVAADLTSVKRELADNVVAQLRQTAGETGKVKKSDTIRALDTAGLSFAEIALYMECKYQMVYNILKYNPNNKLKQ